MRARKSGQSPWDADWVKPLSDRECAHLDVRDTTGVKRFAQLGQDFRLDLQTPPTGERVRDFASKISKVNQNRSAVELG